MKSLKERIIKFNNGHKEEEELFKSPMEIALSIAIYAHREQLRENGEYYINHPYRVATIFHDAISVDDKLISRELADTIGFLQQVHLRSQFFTMLWKTPKSRIKK